MASSLSEVIWKRWRGQCNSVRTSTTTAVTTMEKAQAILKDVFQFDGFRLAQEKVGLGRLRVKRDVNEFVF